MLQKDSVDLSSASPYFFENHPDGICIVDLDGHFLSANASALNLFGYTREEILQISLVQLLDWPGVSRIHSDANEKVRFELDIQHKRGHFIQVRLTCIPFIMDGQKMGRFITFEDITQQQKHNEKLSDIQEMFSFISRKSQNIISTFSADGVFTYVSPSVKALLGYSPEEVIGKSGMDFSHPDDKEKYRKFRNSSYIGQDTERFTGRVRHKNGKYRWYETTIELIRDPSGELIQTICVGRDITSRKEAEETIAHLAYHDFLTDLPNRLFFKKRVSLLLGEMEQELYSLMLLDLDGFKYVNDTFGHEIGDLLLIEVAKRLAHTVGDKGFVARWGGDEFTVLYTNAENRVDLTALIERMKAVISEPILISGHTLFITASIGVSFLPEDGDTVEALIKKADAGMYRAKQKVKD